MLERVPRDVDILIVDDSPAIRARVQAYLKELGFAHVRAEEDVEKALASFRERPAALVLLDMVVGEDRGLDFASEALQEHPMTSIVIMTALPPSHDQVTAAIAEGARDFLPKPITKNGLEVMLARIGPDLIEGAKSLPREDSSYA